MQRSGWGGFRRMRSQPSELADIDRRLDDAVIQLREQQAMVALIDSDQETTGMLLSLLSSVLEQFYSLQTHRRAMLKQQPSPMPGRDTPM
jgi:hypothetical protein